MPVLVALAFVLVASGAQADAARTVSSPNNARITCSIAAALKFSVPANIMLAVAEMEGGRPGQWVRNRNGSYDVGPLQFNTRYLEHLEQRYGITAADVAAADCYPYDLAAWRLRRHLERDQGDAWTRVANYHSRDPIHNATYRRRLIGKAASWSRWLDARFPTYELNGSSTKRGVVRAEAARAGRRARAASNPTVLAAAAPAGGGVYEDGDDEIAALSELLYQSDSGWRLRSESIGSPPHGSLAGGVQLRGHPGYRIREPSRAWGTRSTIERLTQAFDHLLATDPAAPRVDVHDLSLRAGGQMDGHKSHQSGQDVDLAYYQHGCRGDCTGRHLAPQQLDAVRQWRLLQDWLERDQVEFVFIDYALQRPLYEIAKASGATERQPGRWFQYPRGSEFRSGIVRHAPGHANHVHVRFRCAQSNRRFQWSGGHTVPNAEDSISPLFEPIRGDNENELLELLLR